LRRARDAAHARDEVQPCINELEALIDAESDKLRCSTRAAPRNQRGLRDETAPVNERLGRQFAGRLTTASRQGSARSLVGKWQKRVGRALSPAFWR